MTPQADMRRLRRLTVLFFLALALPSGALVWQAFSRLQWETFHQHQRLADELAARIDGVLARLIDTESARPFTDYSFLTVAGAPASNFVQRSPLAVLPLNPELPGLIGYFQVDSDGEFSTPLLPEAGAAVSTFGITPEEFVQRQAIARKIQQILNDNQLVMETSATSAESTLAPVIASAGGSLAAKAEAESARPAPAVTAGPAAFDRLKANERDIAPENKQAATLGRVEDLKLDDAYQARASPPAEMAAAPSPLSEGLEKRRSRKEQSALPDQQAYATAQDRVDPNRQAPEVRVRMFESEVDAFDFTLIGNHCLLYRKVWRSGERIIQGLLFDQAALLDHIVRDSFRATALSRMSNLLVANRGTVVAAFDGGAERSYLVSGNTMRGTLLTRARLAAPLSDLELILSINRLPVGAGGAVIAWSAGLLGIVIAGGLALMYRLSRDHIRLAQQQQDFVSAVSHELKTPLTSIRMYGEMLREGWAPPEKRQEYYAFIHDESERLSRLINNVLNLARMTRNELSLEIKVHTVGELFDSLRSKLGTSVTQAGARLEFHCPDALLEVGIAIDHDCFTQIMINLIDNAVKFSALATNRGIDVRCRETSPDSILISVRDYGPGVAADQINKIFGLFYRGENELTRETSGTGIGLALVQRLVHAIGATIQVVNAVPGAEFRLLLKRAKSPVSARMN